MFRLDLRGAPMIDGDTKLIAHIGYPTASFRAPSIYNPWFRRRGINAVVVPLGVTSENFREAFPQICRFTNFHGALITMPHKATVVGWLDEASAAVRVAGACNAVRRSGDGKLIGDMFDGEGFVRAAAGAGRNIAGQRVHIVGAGGVGSAIAAACAKAGAGEIALTDMRAEATERLASGCDGITPTSRFRSARTTRRVSTSRSMRRRLGPIRTTRCRWTPRVSRRRLSSARSCSNPRRRHFSPRRRRGGLACVTGLDAVQTDSRLSGILRLSLVDRRRAQRNGRNKEREQRNKRPGVVIPRESGNLEASERTGWMPRRSAGMTEYGVRARTRRSSVRSDAKQGGDDVISHGARANRPRQTRMAAASGMDRLRARIL